MVPYLVAYAVAGLVFLCIDLVWLGFVASGLYRSQMGDLLAETFRIGPAIAFYLLYILGVVVFAISPALRGGGPMTALGLGALLGLVAYGTYDLTNWAIIRNWPVLITLVDLAWGTFLTALSALAGFLVASRFV